MRSSSGVDTTDPSAGPVVELARVTKTYRGPPEVRALRAVDLRVFRGEFLVVTGPSGSGKSSLLNIVGLLDRPTAGTYHIEGCDTATLPDHAITSLRGRRIGFVFQQFHLIEHLPAVDNVALPLVYVGMGRTERRARAAAALDQLGMTHRAMARASQLSGGERQRVAIARAIVHAPALLLCDEPTGNLDSESARGVLDALNLLNEAGTTVVLITHDQGVAEHGSRQVAISDGRLEPVPSG